MERKVNIRKKQGFLFRKFSDNVWHSQCRNNRKIVNTLEKMHNNTTWNERVFVGKLTHWFKCYLSEEGYVHYVINSILYINTLQEKYHKMYEKLIHRLVM